ncbi:MAG: VCBS repeat-containing protein, partial [Prochloron sp. SP5CPC1]|nr:VCBS repeat-containing protein [Candidatus Paraprochloron terpiosi SP5CPC1]
EFRTAEVLLSQGNGSFTKITLDENFLLKGDYTNLYVGDFNGDGKDDILRQEKGAWDNDEFRTAEVLLSQGNGTFIKHTLDESLGLKGDLTNLFVKDLDGDGKAEILVQEKSAPNNQNNTLRVLFSDDGYTFTSHLLPEDLNIDGQSGQLHIADYNGSGQNDILVQYYSDNPGLIGFSAITRNSDGPDNLTGGNGSDTYILNGKLALINNLASDLATDQIILKAPVSEITTALSSDGDLEVKIGAKTVARVQNWTMGETYQHLEIFSEDNYVLTPDSSGALTSTGRNFSRETESQVYNAAADTAHPTIATITGGSGNDVLTANNLGNTLIGGAGNDSLNGGTGDDVFFDNLGINIFQGGDGSDTYLIDPGQARNTIDNTATDGAVDIARLQANFTDLAARKQGNNLLLDNGESGDTALNLVVKDWFVNDPQNHLQFVTKDGVRFSVTADEDPVVEIQEFNFSSNAQGADVDLALILPDDFRHPHVRLASGVRLQDSPHNDTLKGDGANNVLISSQGQDYLMGRLGQDVYFVSPQNDPDKPERLYPIINNYASDGVEDVLYLPDLNPEDLVTVRSSEVATPNDLIIGRYNDANELVPLARVKHWFLGSIAQHLKIKISDGVYHLNSDGTLQRQEVDFSTKSEGQTYDSLEDDQGGQVLSLTGSNYNDTLKGDDNTNVFEGGAGRDLFEGRNGQDIYEVRGTTPGQDLKVIVNLADDNQVDTIEIAVNRDELALRRSGQDLYLVSASAPQTGNEDQASLEQIAYAVVQEFFLGENYQHLHLRTADGENYILKIDESGAVELAEFEVKATDSAVNGTLDLRDYSSAIYAVDSPGDDQIIGNDLDNIITSTDGKDRLRGRAGRDTYVIQRAEGAAPRVVTIDNWAHDSSTDILYLDVNGIELQAPQRDGNDLILKAGTDIETVRISRWFKDAQARHLQVLTQDNYLFSLSEDNGEGYLVLQQVDFAKATSGQTFDASINPSPRIDYNSANIRGTRYGDTLTGGSGDNTITGGSQNDLLKGKPGNDQLFAGPGDDTLHGGSGQDHLDGGAGNDLFYLDDDQNAVVGGEGNDTANYAEISLGIDVDLYLGVALKANNQVDYLSSIENVIAPHQNSVLRGSDADNLLRGGNGNDTLTGLGGNDTLVGGEGQDEYFIRNLQGAQRRTVTIHNRAQDGLTDRLYLNIAATDLQDPVQEGNDLLLRTSTDIGTVRLGDWFSSEAARHLEVFTADGSQLELPL